MPVSASKIKEAVVTTAVVLAVIFVLNKTPARPVVQRALAG